MYGIRRKNETTTRNDQERAKELLEMKKLYDTKSN
jgi:hypothetical protein